MTEQEFKLSEKERHLIDYTDCVDKECKFCRRAYSKDDVKEFIRLLKEKSSNVNKQLGLHNVDECECCEKNWQCVYEILTIIDNLAGKELVE